MKAPPPGRAFISTLVLALGVFLICSGWRESAAAQVENTAVQRQEQDQIVQAQKAMWFAHILRQRESGSTVTGLVFPSNQIVVYLLPKGDAFRPLVRLDVRYNRPDWRLVVGDGVPLRAGDGPNELYLYAYLNSRISEVSFEARGPQGQIEREVVYLFAPEAREYRMVSAFDTLTFKVGAGNLIYEQSSFGVFTGQSALLGVGYASPDKGGRWGLSADFHMSVYTVKSSPVDHNPQFFEGNAAVTYSIKAFQSPLWRSRILFGLSTVGLVSHGSPFGFSGLYGPQLGFLSTYYSDTTNSYTFSLRWSPYEGVGLSDERAFLLEGSWDRNLANLRRVRLILGYSNHRFTTVTERIEADFFTLGLGFSI